jgi:hypothetical protein
VPWVPAGGSSVDACPLGTRSPRSGQSRIRAVVILQPLSSAFRRSLSVFLAPAAVPAETGFFRPPSMSVRRRRGPGAAPRSTATAARSSSGACAPDRSDRPGSRTHDHEIRSSNSPRSASAGRAVRPTPRRVAACQPSSAGGYAAGTVSSIGHATRARRLNPSSSATFSDGRAITARPP